ncbi:hypothetical protein MRX96_020609 [Rhipicephalus microplus]
MHRISDEALSLLDEVMDTNGCVKDCFYFFRRWSLESIASTTADVELCCLKNPLNPESDGAAILDDIKTAFVCIQKLGYRFPYLHYLLTPTWQIFKKTMEDFTTRTYRHIDAAARRIEDEKLVSKATILRNLLLEKKLTFGEVFTYTSDFILAGVDTTAFAMTCLLFQLAKNQEAQKKVRQEVQAAVEENSRTIMPEPENMPFLQACLKESLRLMPPSPGIYRVLDHDVVMSGYVVPAGVPIFIDYYVAGRITENFDNPEVFLPERWLKVQREDLHFDRYASLPFSFGPRMCPGRTIAELQETSADAARARLTELECERYQDDPEHSASERRRATAALEQLIPKRIRQPYTDKADAGLRKGDKRCPDVSQGIGRTSEMNVDDAEVVETPSNDSGEDDSDPTRRDADGDTEGWIEVPCKRKNRVSPGEERAQKCIRSRSPTHIAQSLPLLPLPGLDQRCELEGLDASADRVGLVETTVSAGLLRFGGRPLSCFIDVEGIAFMFFKVVDIPRGRRLLGRSPGEPECG